MDPTTDHARFLAAADANRACRQSEQWRQLSLPLPSPPEAKRLTTPRMARAQRETCRRLARYLGARRCRSCQRLFTAAQMTGALASVLHCGGADWPLSAWRALQFFCRSYDLGHDRQCHPEREARSPASTPQEC